MATYGWKSAVNGDWATAADWSPAGPPNAATADATIAVDGAYTVTIATAESFLVDSLTFAPTGAAVLALNGKLTVGGPMLWSGGDVAGPGTLTTTGTTTISGWSYIDGGLTWINSGTVLDSYNIYDDYRLTTSALTNTVSNQATGVFNITADGFSAFYNLFQSAPTVFVNAGLLEKTAGTGIVNFYATLNNTGSVTSTLGVLELDGGGTLGGVIGASGLGEIAFGGGSFSLGGTSRSIANGVGLSGGTVAIASGLNLTLPGPVSWSGGDVAGPGTLTTTGTTTISGWSYIDGGLTWINSGTVLDSYNIYDDYRLTTSALTNTVSNQATGVFNITADGFSAFYNLFQSAPTVFVNAGLLEKTAGTGTVNFYAALNNTGTVKVTSGILELDGGGILGGVVTTTAGGALRFGGGAFTVTGSLVNGGTLALSNQTLTLSGAVTWSGGDVTGPGTLAMTGATTINTAAYIDGGLTWTNSGTVLDSTYIYDGFYSASNLSFGFFNQTLGIFDFTADGFYAFQSYHGAITTFTNAGLLEKTAGTGTVTFEAILHNTGEVTATSGMLALFGGGTVSGTIGGTGGGVVQFGGGSFITTGTVIILDASSFNGLSLINGATWTDSGVTNDSGHFLLGNGTGISTLAISGGASFNFTADDGGIVNGGSNAFTNAGTIAKTGGTGTSTIGVAFSNSGYVDVASGTLKLSGAVSGIGRLQAEAGKTLELASGGIAGSNTIDLNGLNATLKIDTNSSVTNAIIGLGAGSRIDLIAATSVAAVINGSTLTVTPTGGTALNFVSTTSLAGLHVSTGTDGGTGTMVTLSSQTTINQAAASYTPSPVAFGNVHVGATAVCALTVSNIAPAGANTEKLNASLTSSATGFTAKGSFTGLAGGGSNSTALTVALNTLNTGSITGVGTLALASDGTGIDASGTTALPDQTVNVTGAVYAFAAPVLSSQTIDLGVARVGAAALTSSFTLSDGIAASVYWESLIYKFGSSLPGTIIAGQTIGIGVTLTTETSGNFNGSSISTAFTSTGAGTSGLANTVLTSNALTVNGEVFAASIASLSATSVNFGVVHVGDGVGDVVSQSLSVTNVASGALTDSLTGGTDTLGGNYTGPVGFSLGGGLAAGASGTVSFGLSTAASGVVSGNAALGFTSHDADLTDLGINGGTVAVSGTVDNFATAQVEDTGGVGAFAGSNGNYTLNLGSVAQGGAALVGDLGVLNAASGVADLLSGTFAVTGASSFTNAGFTPGFSGLGAGHDERNQAITLNTATSGVLSETIVLTPTGSNANFSGVLTQETITVTGSIVATSGKTYTLTSVPVTIAAGLGNDTIVAPNATLNSHDAINGGGGTNTLVLSGAGSFDLGAPSQLAGIQVVNAGEGQAGAGGTPHGPQIVYLRDGLDLTMNVAPGTPNPANLNPEIITIYGAANSDIINLGKGTDRVVAGGTGETVNGGGGTALVQATAALAGALVNGGTGKTTLELTTGGTATLNAASNDLIVKLDAVTNLTLSKMSFITANGSTGADTITAMAQGQTLTGGGGADTLTGYSGFGDLFSDTSAHMNTTTIQQFGGSDAIDLTDMSSSLAKALVYKGTTSAGTLTVTDGTHTANIKFTGNYTTANFQLGTDNHTGSLITFH